MNNKSALHLFSHRFNHLFGEYDLIAKIKAEDFEKLGSIVVNKIRTIKGVIDTETLIGTKFFNFFSLFI